MWHHPMGWDPGLSTQWCDELSYTLAILPSSHDGWYHSTRSQNKPFLLCVAVSRHFVSAMRKAMNASPITTSCGAWVYPLSYGILVLIVYHIDCCFLHLPLDLITSLPSQKSMQLTVSNFQSPLRLSSVVKQLTNATVQTLHIHQAWSPVSLGL